MTFKKQLDSKNNIIIAGGDHSKLFLSGFRYRIGDNIYSVTKEFRDGETHFRRVVGSDGSVEDMTVESIIRDFKDQPGDVEIEILKPMDEVVKDGNEETEE